ncbi:MAG: magnesium/cobalt transporter CorA [SAR202 cluster bacterium]|nr:magnesium/cobalt transporter CorA [SAR202 cluster bacterium]
MPRTIYYIDPDGDLKRDLGDAELRSVLQSGHGLLWVDINEISEEDAHWLHDFFGFHPLTVETCLSPQLHSPSVRAHDEYLFLVLHGIDYTAESALVETSELDLFIGRGYVVSSHNVFLYSVAAVARQVEEGQGRLLNRGPDFLAHALIEALVHNIQPTVEGLADRSDEIEEDIFQKPHPSTLEAILQVKRSALRLRRAFVPQGAVLSSLRREEFDQITEEAGVFYRDAYDRQARLQGAVEILRERSDTMLATYLSAIAHQQNETMKTLSVFAAIFLPLSLLAGIYGMNFDNMPELHYRWAYPAVLGGMGTVAASTIWWFWARRWFTGGRRRLARFVPAAIDPERLISHVSRFARFPHSNPMPPDPGE